MSQAAPLLADAEQAMKDGREAAAERNLEALTVARAAALLVALADPKRTADADRVRANVQAAGVQLAWGSWAGVLFLRREWEPTGEFVMSRFNRGHIRVWRLREQR